MPYIPTEKVESSNIEAIGYHRQTQTLRIAFKSREGPSRVYDYPMVLEQEYKRLMEAESKGKFFASRIKPMYAHRTPRPEELQPPTEPCCNHPDRDTCDESCFPCDEWCCPQDEKVEDVTPQERTDLIDTVCRCCDVAIRAPPEDACDLCAACYRSKGGDTNEPCMIDHCPHGADGTTCEEGCPCGCHQPDPESN